VLSLPTGEWVICRHTRDKVSDDGVPRRSVIRSNWCTTFLPGNNGVPVRTSANMHPMLQISIAGVYCHRKLTVFMVTSEIGKKLRYLANKNVRTASVARN
jgi:hypothetical protein